MIIYKTEESAKYLTEEKNFPVETATMYQWRSQGRGPRYMKLNGRIFYRESDLDSFVDSAVMVETLHSQGRSEKF
jgi:hypothetical protein